MRESTDGSGPLGNRSRLIEPGRVLAGALLAPLIIVASYVVAGALALLAFREHAGPVALFLGAPLPGLVVAAYCLHQRCRSRTLLGLGIGTLLASALLVVLVAAVVSDVHIGF